MEKIGFVILHYLSYDDTIECVNKIEEYCTDKNYNIVIVDNASDNNTGKQLSELYFNKDKITVIMNHTNLGFAKGNNVGFRYAKYQLNCDYIILINNDAFLIQNDFCEKIVLYYTNYKYEVLGPKIISNGINSGKDNPMRLNPKSMSEIKNNINKLYIYMVIEYLGLSKIFDKVSKFVQKYNNIEREKKSNIDYDAIAFNVQLHGSCIVFSPSFVSEYDGLNEETFMYYEEDILYFEMLKNKKTLIYAPDIEVFHKGNIATNMQSKKVRKRKIRKYKLKIESAKILKKIAQTYWK